MQTKYEKENKYIIKNYKNMTYREIAENLGLSHTTVCGRIMKMRKRGVIGRKNNINWAGTEEKDIEPEPVPKYKQRTFKKGKRYKIEHRTVRGLRFIGIYIEKINGMFIFESVPGGYMECFLNRDFDIGEYKAEGVG